MDLLVDLSILAAVMAGLYWFAGKVVDDVMAEVDDQWSRWRAWEEIGRRDR